MAELVQLEPPREAEHVVQAILTGLAERRAFRTPRLSRADTRKLVLARPHRVAVLPLAMAKGDVDATLTNVGWRFIVEVEGEDIASAEALSRPDGRFQFGGLNEGPLVSSFAAALRQVEFREESLEPRLLLVPALNLAALWLTRPGEMASRFAQEDAIVPIEPTHAVLPAYRRMPVGQYLATLRDLAADVPTGGAKGG